MAQVKGQARQRRGHPNRWRIEISNDLEQRAATEIGYFGWSHPDKEAMLEMCEEINRLASQYQVNSSYRRPYEGAGDSFPMAGAFREERHWTPEDEEEMNGPSDPEAMYDRILEAAYLKGLKNDLWRGLETVLALGFEAYVDYQLFKWFLPPRISKRMGYQVNLVSTLILDAFFSQRRRVSSSELNRSTFRMNGLLFMGGLITYQLKRRRRAK